MTNYKSQNIPQQVDLLKNLKHEIFNTLNCAKFGVIDSFDATAKTATVQILTKRILMDGTTNSYPPLLDCPVFTLQGSTAFIQMPITKGDICLVVFSDKNIDGVFETGSETIPYSTRSHTLSDGIVFVGFNMLNSSMPAYESGKMTISYGGSKVTISSDGSVNIDVEATKKLTVTGGLSAEVLGSSSLALFSEISALTSWASTHVHTDPQGGSTGAPTTGPATPTGTLKLKGA